LIHKTYKQVQGIFNLIFAKFNLVLGTSKMLGVERIIETKSHAPSSYLNPTLINPLMLAKALKGQSHLKVTGNYESK
jgi:hypothetical protein